MPVVYGMLFALIVVGIGIGLAYLGDLALTGTFQNRSFRKWLRRRLIHSYTCRRISRRLGSRLLD